MATKRKRVTVLLVLLLLLSAGAVVLLVDGRVFHGAGTGAVADEAHKVVPGGTIRDGSVVTGEVRAAGDRLDYTIVLDDFTQFSLVDATAKVDLQLDNAGSPESNILPGPAQYAVGKPGTYHLSVSLPDGGTGPYTFRVVARRLHKHDIQVGDEVRGRLDTPGAVDEYIVALPPDQKVTIDNSHPCEDVSMGYTPTRTSPGSCPRAPSAGTSPRRR
ncbi:hypothetical protein GCM10029964_012970 [Kibdelosporangium lantanae]